MMSRSRTTLTIGAIGLLAGAAALAGPLDPPVGPVGSTMKPLDQVEPRTAINSDNTPRRR